MKTVYDIDRFYYRTSNIPEYLIGIFARDNNIQFYYKKNDDVIDPKHKLSNSKIFYLKDKLNLPNNEPVFALKNYFNQEHCELYVWKNNQWINTKAYEKARLIIEQELENIFDDKT